MIEELLKIISAAEKLISQHEAQYQRDNIQLIASGFRELQEIDEKIYQHFQEELTR